MKFDATIPIYIQIIDRIKKDIVTGVLARGDRLDSIRALAEKFEVTLITMQRAYSELERLGVIHTRRGIGSFVTGDETVIAALKTEMTVGLVKTFLGGMEDLGYSKNEIFEITKKELGI